MAIAWTSEQILALAPDPASAKAGKGLASQRKWVSLGSTDQAAWGECQGSAATPYQTQIDLCEPAFHCTCPSRKFPCKHGLGLFLLLEGNSRAFTQTAIPAWVAGWLAKRAQKIENKAKKTEAESKPDPAAQAKRQTQREAKVAAGIRELDLWLRDQMRHGLAALQTASYGFWDAPAARMVDAQAPGLARLLKDMAGIPASGTGWQDRLLERLGRLHLLLEGYQRIETLPPATQADLRTLIGWTQNQEELLTQSGVNGTWAVLGQVVQEEERFRVQRTWVWNQSTGRPALILDFSAFASQPLDKSLVPKTEFDAELVFYPGGYPLRGLVKTRHTGPAMVQEMPGFSSILTAIEAYTDAITANPWLEVFPLPLKSVIPIRDVAGQWRVRDLEGNILFLAPRFGQGWHLRALSGGHPCDIFGEWNGDHFYPVSLWAEGKFVHFNLTDGVP